MVVYECETDVDDEDRKKRPYRVRCGACEGCKTLKNCGDCAACSTRHPLKFCLKRRCSQLQFPREKKREDHEDVLEDLAKYIGDKGGSPEEILNYWRVEVSTRKEGATAGGQDTYFYNQQGKKFRSRTEVADALGIVVAAQDGPAKKKQKKSSSSS